MNEPDILHDSLRKTRGTYTYQDGDWTYEELSAQKRSLVAEANAVREALREARATLAHAEAQVDELGNALGRVMVRLGVVNDESLTGPQLLFAAESWLAPTETPNAD